MYRVVLAVSGRYDPPVETIVETIAGLPSATDDVAVTVLTVFSEFEVRDEGASVSSEDLYDAVDVPETVLAVRDRLDAAGVETTVRREHGEPAAEILDVAAEIDADAIAVQGRERSPVGKAIFGSVAQSVLLDSERPVVVVPPTEA